MMSPQSPVPLVLWICQIPQWSGWKSPTDDSSLDNLPLGSLFWNLCVCVWTRCECVCVAESQSQQLCSRCDRAQCPVPTSPLVLRDPSTAASGLPVPAKILGIMAMKGKECSLREQSQGMVSIRMAQAMCSAVTQGLGDSPSVVFHPADVICFLWNNRNGEEDEYFWLSLYEQ